MQKRVPSAVVKCIGFVSGYVLKFNKISVDGSGKGNIESTGDENDVVYGVVYELDPSEKHLLDKAEGLGKGYDEGTVKVSTEFGEISAITYIATNKDDSLKLYHWYKAIVVSGAIENNLPPEYLAGIEAVESVEDPDRRRREKNMFDHFGTEIYDS